jgi:hypothetical protein
VIPPLLIEETINRLFQILKCNQAARGADRLMRRGEGPSGQKIR